MRKPDIKNYIESHMQKFEDDKIAKAEEVLSYLTRVMRGEEKEEKIIQTQLGDIKRIEVELKVSDRIKAAEQLGKRYALFRDKVELSGEVKTNNVFESISTEELKKFINGQ